MDLAGYFKRHRYVIISISFIILIIIISSPFKIQYSRKGTVKLYPAKVWTLVRGNDGMLLASITDYVNGVNPAYQVDQFERGASIQVELRKDLKSGMRIEVGDTLGKIHSSTAQENYTEILGKLELAKAQLDVSLSGAKETVVKQKIKALDLAKAEAEKQQRVVDRLKNLFQNKYVSEEEYQLEFDELRTLQIAVEVQQAELEATQSGDKESELKRLLANIKSIEQEKENIEQQLDALNIIAPFSGVIDHSFNSDTLLILSEANRYMISFPVPIAEEDYLETAGQIDVEIGKNNITSRISEINNSIYVISEKQCLLVHAIIEEDNNVVRPGMVAKAKIMGKQIPALQYFLHLINS